MARIIGGIGTTHVPAIGSAIANGNAATIPTGSRSSTGFHYVHAVAGAETARRRRGVLQRSRPQLLPRQDADLRGRRRARIPQRGRRLGHCRCRKPYPGRRRSVLASDRSARRRRVRHHDVPGNAGRSRGRRSRSTCSGRADAGRSGPSRSSINTVQHPLPSVARCFKLGQLGRARASRAFRRTSRCWWSAPAGSRTSSTASARASSTRTSTRCAWTSSGRDPEALTRYTIPEIVEHAGSQGVELLNWIAMRGALDRACDQTAPQLSHPDFEHGRRDPRVREPPPRAAQGRLEETRSRTRPPRTKSGRAAFGTDQTQTSAGLQSTVIAFVSLSNAMTRPLMSRTSRRTPGPDGLHRRADDQRMRLQNLVPEGREVRALGSRGLAVGDELRDGGHEGRYSAGSALGRSLAIAFT